MREQSGLSRRAFLVVAAAGGALGAAGLISQQRLAESRYAPSSWSHMDARVTAVFQKMASVWLPQSNTAFPRPDAVPYLDSLNHALSLLPAQTAKDVHVATLGFEMAALVYGWYGQPFSKLPPDEARAYLQRWSDGLPPQKALIAAFRQLVSMAYWRHAATWPATGYAGPLHERAHIPSLGDAPEPVRL